MKNVFKIFVLLLLSVQLQAQEKIITGIVTAASDGLPLPGVTVLIKGTTNGTSTDINGKYTINAMLGDKLIFSFVSMKTKKIVVGKSNIINVVMKDDTTALDEVVITGYATTTKTKSSVSSVRVSSIVVENRPNNGFTQTLSGQISGLKIEQGKTQLGQNSIVRLRGVNSIRNNNDPLYILDGKAISESDFQNIEVKKIKHIEVLSAQQGNSLHGYKGRKGVIVLRTKGKKNVTDLSIINDFLNDTYAQINENPFKRVQFSPLSTFSIDVDKASYSNVRRMINNGQKVAKDAVKIEEMVNYFNYKYPQPLDKHPFSINTEVAATPWHKDTQLVKIGLQGKTHDYKDLPASNLTFLIDVSGSMSSSNKLPLLKAAFKLLVKQLRKKDKVSIIVYAGAAGVVLEPTSGDKKKEIMLALDNLQAGGSTAGGAGIELAYKLAEKHFKKGGNNRVILATDGDFNVGASSDNAMKTLIEEKRKSGVFLSVLGFGYGNYKDSKLETLADKGNGNHAYIDNMQEAQKVFGKEFGGTLFTIAKDVKIQVEFNPKKVKGYRLIGYENRLLADEDFVDDTKDAGELGSGHTVTALYEIIPVDVKSNYLKDITNLKYTEAVSKNDFSDELFTVKFRYKKPEASQSIELVHIQKDVINNASEDMNFASAVALFGMQLRGSKYYNNVSIDKVIDLAENGRGDDKDGYRAEFIRLLKSYNSL